MFFSIFTSCLFFFFFFNDTATTEIYTLSLHDAHPLYQTAYYDSLVAKMLACGNPEKIGYIEYRCLHCGQGKHLVAMSCKSSLCLRCAKVAVDNWVSQVSRVLHEGVIYPQIYTLSLHDARPTFYQNAPVVLSAFMRC